MKKTFPIALGGALLLATAAIAPVGAQQDDGRELEMKLEALEVQMTDLARQNKDLTAQLEQVMVYLDQQADAAAMMMSVVGEAEDLGFTPGINFRSREVLVSGWREYYHAQQQGVPAPPKPAPPQPQRRR